MQSAIPVLVLTLAAWTHPVGAQRVPATDMIDGRWRGWLQQADEDSIRVSFDVQHDNKKHLLITMNGRSGITYDMGGAKVKNDVLTFDWATGGAGSFLYCRLSRRDGKTFEGVCDDRAPGATGKAVHVWLEMTPPEGR